MQIKVGEHIDMLNFVLLYGTVRTWNVSNYLNFKYLIFFSFRVEKTVFEVYPELGTHKKRAAAAGRGHPGGNKTRDRECLPKNFLVGPGKKNMADPTRLMTNTKLEAANNELWVWGVGVGVWVRCGP
jgi:hypothetical protein